MITTQSRPTRSCEAMPDSLDLIKLELVSEYENAGRIDIAVWVRQYPVHRMELLDFWVWLKGTPTAQMREWEPDHAIEADEIEAYKDSVRDACLAVTFGEAMLKPEAVSEMAELDALGADLERFRAQPSRVREQRQTFRKAVVYTWVVSCLQQNRPRVTRLATQKVSYLLEHAMSLRVFIHHDRKPLGPYDYKSRYKDAEPVAKRKGWLKVSGTTLQASDDLAEMRKYLSAYVRSQELASRFVSYLSNRSEDELETLATVHWTARELGDVGDAVNIDTVWSALETSSDWQAKLRKPNFSRLRIGNALRLLEQLRLVRMSA